MVVCYIQLRPVDERGLSVTKVLLVEDYLKLTWDIVVLTIKPLNEHNGIHGFYVVGPTWLGHKMGWVHLVYFLWLCLVVSHCTLAFKVLYIGSSQGILASLRVEVTILCLHTHLGYYSIKNCKLTKIGF